MGDCGGRFGAHRSDQYLPGLAAGDAYRRFSNSCRPPIICWSTRCKLDCDVPQRAIIHGDALSASIAAASIIAKVERDRMISAWDPVFPMYGLASNKGYSTPHHIAALREHGPSPLHRQSFAPVWNAPIPQEVLGFMLDEAVDTSAAERKWLPFWPSPSSRRLLPRFPADSG